MQHRWPPMAMAIKAIIRNCRSWQGRIISNEEVACGVAIAVHCFDWYQKCARKKSNFPQKRTFSDNSKFRFYYSISEETFSEALLRRRSWCKKIANIIPDFSPLCMRFRLLLLLQQQLLSREFSRFTNNIHKPPENWAKTGSAFNQKVFLMTYNDVASIEKYLCISFTH